MQGQHGGRVDETQFNIKLVIPLFSLPQILPQFCHAFLKKNQLLCSLDSLEATNGALITKCWLEDHVMVILEGKCTTFGSVMVFLYFNSSPIKKQIYGILQA